MRTIEEKAKELAKNFNSVKIPALGYIEMAGYLSETGIRYFSIMMRKELRNDFFDIKKDDENHKMTIYCQKKEPIHFSRFVKLINFYDDYKKRRVVAVASKIKHNYTEGNYNSPVTMSENLTIEQCIDFLREKGYKGKIEKIVKSEFEL